MTASNRPARWRLGLLAASLAAAIAVPALAHDTLRTIGTPPDGSAAGPQQVNPGALVNQRLNTLEVGVGPSELSGGSRGHKGGANCP